MRLQTPEQNYLAQTFPLHDPDLLRIKQKLIDCGLDFMSISGPEARILQFLIRGFSLENVVEIGTLHGYSAVAMAKAIPSGSGKVISIEKNPENFKIAEANVAASDVSGRVQLLCGDALEVFRSIESEGPFDLVFIDANKGGYCDYLDWAERNVRRGGLIIGDNTFLWGGVWGESRDTSVSAAVIKVMQTFNLRLADPKNYNSILIPTFEGMTVAQRL